MSGRSRWVLSALVADQVRALVDQNVDKALDRALIDAAAGLSEHPLCRALARLEPAALAGLARIAPASEGWRVARQGVEALLGRSGRAGTDLVLRWLASFLTTPGDRRAIAHDVAVLVAALPVRSAG